MYSLILSGILVAGAQGGPTLGEEIARRMGEALGAATGAAAVSDCPATGNSLRGSTAPVTCGCPAIDPEMLGTSVWGNQVYTDDSNICLAAIHDGRVTTAGGRVTVWAAPGQARYSSASRNGITSWDYLDFEGSFRFTPPVRRHMPRSTEEVPEARRAAPIPADADPVRAEPAPKAMPRTTGARPYKAAPAIIDAPLAARTKSTAATCPEIGRPLRGTSAALTCHCPAIAREMLGTSVWGNQVYTDDSNLCLAAIHDGRVSLAGGMITVWAAPGRAIYRSATRNGITSIAYRDFEGSIRFTPPPARAR